MIPPAQTLYAVIEGTWPPAAVGQAGPFTIRDGAGGGKRVSAATAKGPVTRDDLPGAEAAMQALGQVPLFMIREGDDALDALLAARGYAVVDPVNMYCAPVSLLAGAEIPPVTAYDIWEPLAVMREIWAAGGIGPARIDVMARAGGPKTGLFGRHANHPAAAGFCAVHAGVAMVHALEILPRHRRVGLGRHLMHHAADWAARQGAGHIAAVCTQVNGPANGLYASLGMSLVGEYHYRQKEETGT